MSKQAGILSPKAKDPRPVIISPSTGRPMVEDILGRPIYERLMRMLEKDKRLSPDMKHEVILRVLRRRREIDDGSRTLADVAAYEAGRISRDNTN